MTRVAIYARYSSDNQREASIEDQVRICREHAARQGWEIAAVHSDAAISGVSMAGRAGLRALLDQATEGRFDLVVTEALDRLSRGQADVAHIFQELEFRNIGIVTLAEGEISELHVGLKGTMNALYIKDLSAKTRRGMRGRVEHGKAGGGRSYGYAVARTFDAAGEPVRGEREIVREEAEIILRIFREYADGLSPKTIAFQLNRDGVAAPRGANGWTPSTLYGNWRRGTGILNNELYAGRLIWNRQHFVKDPRTGRRQARMNAPEEIISTEVPELRIVPVDLWDRVKARQGIHRQQRPEKARRPVHLLSGLLVCGACGGGYSMVSKHHYGCFRARNTGTCDNRLTIRRDRLEERVLDGLRRNLMQPAAVKVFVEEFTREVNRLVAEHDARRHRLEGDLSKIDRRQRALMEAIMDGTPARLVNAELVTLEERRNEIAREIEAVPPPLPRLHPNLPELYRRKVESLEAALRAPETASPAGLALRGLIDRIRLVPADGVLRIELEGARAALLALGATDEKHLRPVVGPEVQGTLVAGAGFEPTTFRL